MKHQISEVMVSVKILDIDGVDERRVYFMRMDKVQEIVDDTGSLGALIRGLAEPRE